MYNAVSKFSTIAVLAIAMLSCDSSAKRQRQAAEDLVAQTQTLLQERQFDAAFELMDSVDHAYPTEIDSRRKVTRLRSQAMADYAEWQIYQSDSIIAALEGTVDALSKKFRHVDGGDISGYYVMDVTSAKDIMAASTIEGRIDDESYGFYIVASNSAAPIGIRQIAVVTNDGEMSSEAIPTGSDRSGETGPGAIDLATFQLSEVEPLLTWLAGHTSDVRHAVIIGTDSKQIPYTPAQAKALVDTWQFGQMAAKLHQARLAREKYQRQLIIARDHSVNLDD